MKEYNLNKFVGELNPDESMWYQTQRATIIGLEINILLLDEKKRKGNNRHQLLSLLDRAIKCNYSKRIFDENQINIFMEIAEVCSYENVLKEQYTQFKRKLKDANIKTCDTRKIIKCITHFAFILIACLIISIAVTAMNVCLLDGMLNRYCTMAICAVLGGIVGMIAQRI